MNRDDKIEQILIQWDQQRREGKNVDLATLCSGCGELIDEIRPQVEALEQMYGLLNVETDPGSETIDESPQEYWPDIPGFEYREYLGAGGMGVVFKAFETSLSRVVALKLIRDSKYATSQQHERFRQEAETVARLKHPNIVQVHQVGRHFKQPYVSLEFVEGKNLGEKIGGRPQDPKATARIIETVARAVHYAHQQGVVHRDLKPANILLQTDEKIDLPPLMETDKPHRTRKNIPSKTNFSQWSGVIPKIADFGIAKRMDEDRQFTKTGDVMGTPSYMSPEQATGQTKQIGPATDVYGLGAILYEMLTGRPPFLAPTSFETLEQVRDRQPVPPKQLQPSLPDDIENICLKCLEKEMPRRYATAEDLADDLQRFQNGQPVVARPVSRSIKCWRWCKRNPVVATLTFALALTFITGVAGITWKWREAVESNRRSELALEKARLAIDQYFTLTSEEVLLEQPGFQELRKELLSTALRYYEQLVEQYGERSELNLDLASAHAKIARIQLVLGSMDTAARHYETSIDLHQQLLKQQKDNLEIGLSLAKAKSGLAIVKFRTGQDRAAGQLILEAIDLAEKTRASTPDFKPAIEVLTDAYRLRGRMLSQHRDVDAAFEAFRKSISIGQGALSDTEVSDRHRFVMARSYRSLGQLYFEVGQWKQAGESYDQSTQQLDQLIGHPNIQKYKLELSFALDGLASLQQQQGALRISSATRIRSKDITLQLAKENPQVYEYQVQLAKKFEHLGVTLMALQDTDGSQESLESAEQTLTELLDKNESLRDVRAQLASVQTNRGVLEMSRGQPRAAIVAFRQALKHRVRLSEDFPDMSVYQNGLAMTHHNLTVALHAVGEIDRALESQKTAVAITEKLKQEFDEIPVYQCNWATTQLTLANLYLTTGQTKNAVDAYERVIADWKKLSPDDPRIIKHRYRMSSAFYELGRAQQQAGHDREAKKLIDRAANVASSLVKFSPDLPRYQRHLANVQTMQGNFQSMQGQYKKAQETFDEAEKIGEKLLEDFPNVVDNIKSNVALRMHLGLHWVRQGELEKGRLEYEKAIELAERLLDSGDESYLPHVRWLAIVKTNLGGLLNDQKQSQKSVKVLNEAIELWKQLAEKFPHDFETQLGLSLSHNHLGANWARLRKHTDAKSAYTRSLEFADNILEQEPSHFQAQKFVLSIRWGRARVLNRLGDYRGAASDWQQALKVAPRQHHRLIRMERAWSLNKAGDHETAVSVADTLVEAESEVGQACYIGARLMGQAIKAVAKDKTLDAEQKKRLQNDYQTKLIKWLQQAKTDNFFTNPQNLRALDNFDFSAIRKTEAFQSFVKSVQQ